MDFLPYFIEVRTQIHPLRAAFIAIFNLSRREMMQNHLHHREFIKICIK
jgi:hypothetical protein